MPRTVERKPHDTIAAMEKTLRRFLRRDAHLELRCMADTPALLVPTGYLEELVTTLVLLAREQLTGGDTLVIHTRTVECAETPDSARGDLAPGRHVSISAAVKPAGGAETAGTANAGKSPETEAARGLLQTLDGLARQQNGRCVANGRSGGCPLFTIYLPTKPQSADEPAERDSSGIAAPRTILLCDDEDLLRNLTKQVLERNGFRVLPAENGARAVELARAHVGTIDVVVTDMIMPEINGSQVAASVRCMHPNARVIYLSGYPKSILADHGINVDGDEFLEKPFRWRALLDRVRGVLGIEQGSS